MTTLQQVLHVIGPPGTGKTTRLLDLLSRELEQGTPPSRIVYCSFTRAAVREAKRRVYHRFSLHDRDLPYFGTIHSIAFRHLGLGTTPSRRLMIGETWKAFCESAHLETAGTPDDPEAVLFDPDDEEIGRREADVLLAWYDWARQARIPLDEASRRFEPPTNHDAWSVSRCLWFAEKYEAFKATNQAIDFVDMLLAVLSEGWAPPVDVLIVDEAQDLSPLEVEVIRLWAGRASRVILGYDDDQAIYGWKAADPAWLHRLPGEREILSQSHRVPAAVAVFAQGIIARNRNRVAKEWVSAPRPGSVVIDADLDDLIDRIADPGASWFLLARHNHLLRHYATELMEAGIPFVRLRGPSPMSSDAARWAHTALRLGLGMTVTVPELKGWLRAMPARSWWDRGAKARIEALRDADYPLGISRQHLAPWGASDRLLGLLASADTALDTLAKVTADWRTYFAAVFSRYALEAFERPPHVLLGSIHSVKGQEAANVVLLPDITGRVAELLADDPEPERRVWYVGATRAQHNLFILEPRTAQCFDEW